jgi:hypothetical protein
MQLQSILATRERAAGALIDRPRSAGYFEIRRMSDYGTTAHGEKRLVLPEETNATPARFRAITVT